MSSVFKDKGSNLPDQLVLAVEDLYKEWSKRFKSSNEIIAPYYKPYFIGEGKLKKTAGLIQIRHFAEATNDERLLALNRKIKELLKETKQAFYKLLIDPKGINYFGVPAEYTNTAIATHDFSNSLNGIDYDPMKKQPIKTFPDLSKSTPTIKNHIPARLF